MAGAGKVVKWGTSVSENRMAMGCETTQGHCKDFAFILKAMGSHWSVSRQGVTQCD